jgi:hypothetical protein
VIGKMNIVLDVIVGVIFVVSMVYMVPRLARSLQEFIEKGRKNNGGKRK